MGKYIEDYQEIRFIKPLVRIASWFALIPPYEYYDGQKRTLLNLYYAIVISLEFCTSALSLNYIIQTYETSAQTCLYCLSYIGSSALVLSAMISTCLNSENFRLFNMLFDDTDSYLKTNRFNKRGNKPLAQVVLALFINTAMSAYETYFTINMVGLTTYLSTIMISTNNCFTLFTVLLMYNYCWSLKLRLNTLNMHLKNIKHMHRWRNMHGVNLISVKLNNYKIPRGSRTVLDMRKLYSEIVNIIKLFNRIFGWQMLFLFGIIVTGLLQMIDLEMFIIIKNVEREVAMGIRLMWISRLIVFTTMGIVVAVTCDMTTKEAQRTATVCYNLLLEIPAGSDNAQDRILREELILLAQQATHQCPRFSAAGFFNVDYTMLFGLLGTVTSYVIVLIQVNK